MADRPVAELEIRASEPGPHPRDAHSGEVRLDQHAA